MQQSDLQKNNLPDVPGVYIFKKGRTVLYVGKATYLRDRVRSYFSNDLIDTRGPRIVDMVTRADRVAYETTPTVLEALVREAALIKKYNPVANSEGKDDKTFLYVVITKEEIPRVLVVRGKELFRKASPYETRAIYGPFPSGTQLREALRIIRRIFPFFDTTKPVGTKSKHQAARVAFNTQIKQYPSVNGIKEYRRTIRHIMLLLSGRGAQLRATLKAEMRTASKEERFEDAIRARRALFALDHLQDVSLIKDESLPQRGRTSLRIESYDTAHLAGTNAVGVMIVIENGMPKKSAYRTFRIHGIKKNDDIASLKEILSRRLNHLEWSLPNVIVVDGGKTQKKAAETVLAENGIRIPVVAVVKDERHRPRAVFGARTVGINEADAVLANAEAHQFSLARHRYARSRLV